MKNKTKLLAIVAITASGIAAIAVQVAGVWDARDRELGSFSVVKPPLKLTLENISIMVPFNESARTRQDEYQVDVWSFLERTDGNMISNEDNVTLGGIQLRTTDGDRIPNTDMEQSTWYESRHVPHGYTIGKKIDFSQNSRLLRHSLIIKREHIHKLSDATITIFLGMTNKEKEPQPYEFVGIHLPVQ
ncbi:MAG: hypothetical protein ACYTAO_11290 [Planctomycetota bacterium]|jgi:hypothetical protein